MGFPYTFPFDFNVGKFLKKIFTNIADSLKFLFMKDGIQFNEIIDKMTFNLSVDRTAFNDIGDSIKFTNSED